MQSRNKVYSITLLLTLLTLGPALNGQQAEAPKGSPPPSGAQSLTGGVASSDDGSSDGDAKPGDGSNPTLEQTLDFIKRKLMQEQSVSSHLHFKDLTPAQEAQIVQDDKLKIRATSVVYDGCSARVQLIYYSSENDVQDGTTSTIEMNLAGLDPTSVRVEPAEPPDRTVYASPPWTVGLYTRDREPTIKVSQKQKGLDDGKQAVYRYQFKVTEKELCLQKAFIHAITLCNPDQPKDVF